MGTEQAVQIVQNVQIEQAVQIVQMEAAVQVVKIVQIEQAVQIVQIEQALQIEEAVQALNIVGESQWIVFVIANSAFIEYEWILFGYVIEKKLSVQWKTVKAVSQWKTCQCNHGAKQQWKTVENSANVEHGSSGNGKMRCEILVKSADRALL